MSRNKRLFVLLLAVSMMIVSQLACGGSEEVSSTVVPTNAAGEAAEDVGEVTVNVNTDTSVDEGYVIVERDGKEIELSVSKLNERLDCFAQLPKGNDSPSELPAQCVWGLVTEYYNTSYTCQSHMQKTGLPSWTCK